MKTTILLKPVALLIIQVSSIVLNGVSQVPRSVPQQEPNRSDFPVVKLREAITKAKSSLKDTQSGLKTQYVRKPGGQQSILSGYYAEDVIRNIELGKTTLITSLDGVELAGYRAHVQEFYPNPELEFVAYSKDAKPLVTVESANESYAEVNRYVEKIEESTARPTIDLKINSAPSTAYFELWVDGGDSARTLTTNNPMSNIARGYYSYRVTKGDHKKIEGKLDLIDGDGTELHCTMHKAEDREGPYPCSLR